ncbi:hypothetical protein [Elizabethkingia anophelis]|uniref:hypothetical protein n=2 Tax=Elizabethkingia anophelis TaxID=1117645 RepID=UPI00200EEB98|nr:hypothetical protein [Elizabethkingia anophelis]MCL1034641.1 hypothetical protein [Elizabethkingia anophelis]
MNQNLTLKQNKNKSWLTRIKLFDRAKIKKPIIILIGSILMVIGGILPFVDNMIPKSINEKINSGRFQDVETLIWSLSITISPLILLLAARMKAHWATYVVPIYTFTYQFLTFALFAAGSNLKASSAFIYYVIGITIIVFIIYNVISLYIKTIFLKDETKNELLDQMLKLKFDETEESGKN